MVFHTDLDCAGEKHYIPEYVADYYPFGKILREWTTCEVERYLTTYHERDKETGYDYRGARYYDSELGRFLGVDPLAADYPLWSTYQYVLNNPLSFIDPNGQEPIPANDSQRKITSTVGDNGTTIITEQYQEVVTKTVETTSTITLIDGSEYTYVTKSQVTTRVTTNTVLVVSENGSVLSASQASVTKTTDHNTGETRTVEAAASGGDVNLSSLVEMFVSDIGFSFARQEAVSPGGSKSHINHFISGKAWMGNRGNSVSKAGLWIAAAGGMAAKNPYTAPAAPFIGAAGGATTVVGGIMAYGSENRSDATLTVYDTTPLNGRSSPPGRSQALHGLRSMLTNEIR